MTIKVLVVDDSSFFRRRISDIINSDPEMEVIDVAVDGQDAVNKAIALKPDVITMDVEMPVMDGIVAVKEIMRKAPTNIFMFSSLTHKNAQVTLDALNAGAKDFLPKKFEDIARNKEEAITELQQRIKAIVKSSCSRTAPVTMKRPSETLATTTRPSGKKYKIVAVGTSTGGPVALQSILAQLPSTFPHPILLIQHMPAFFTEPYVNRLSDLCNIKVKLAQTGMILEKSTAYFAPGGKQMLIEKAGATNKIKITDGDPSLYYHPCVDVTFTSVAEAYGKDVLAIILTGMGSDGKKGCELLKKMGATIWAQDEASSVVYGMPQAVFNAGLASESITLTDMHHRILKEVGG